MVKCVLCKHESTSSNLVTSILKVKAMFTYDLISFLFYAATAFFLVLLMVMLAFFFSPMHRYYDKSAPYECGFHPFDDTRKEFNVHFYLVALLFVAFDLEVVILIPFVVSLITVEPFVYWPVIVFIIIIAGGFIYEWRSGALLW